MLCAALLTAALPAAAQAIELDSKVLDFKLPDQIKWGR
jgi:hypothetical protein